MIKLFKTQKTLSSVTITTLYNTYRKYEQKYDMVMFVVSDDKNALHVFLNNNDCGYKQIVEQHKIEGKQYHIGMLINIIREV